MTWALVRTSHAQVEGARLPDPQTEMAQSLLRRTPTPHPSGEKDLSLGFTSKQASTYQ